MVGYLWERLDIIEGVPRYSINEREMKHIRSNHIVGSRTKDLFYFIAFIIPAFFVLSLVTFGPIIQAVDFSFRDIGLMSAEMPFTGFKNYATVMRDSVFWRSLANTGIFAGISVSGQFTLAFLLAILLNRKMRGTIVFRMLALVPWMTPLVVVGLLWRWMYNPSFGIINQALLGMGLISKPLGWLGSMSLALPAVILADIWKRTPLMMIMLLAGLQTVPKELYEAGKIDGTNWVSELRHITLPCMRGTIGVVILMGLIWNIKQMVIIWLMTKGGPAHATETLIIYVYKNAFQFFDMGYASAIGILMMVISIGLAVVYLRIIREKV